MDTNFWRIISTLGINFPPSTQKLVKALQALYEPSELRQLGTKWHLALKVFTVGATLVKLSCKLQWCNTTESIIGNLPFWIPFLFWGQILLDFLIPNVTKGFSYFLIHLHLRVVSSQVSPYLPLISDYKTINCTN